MKEAGRRILILCGLLLAGSALPDEPGSCFARETTGSKHSSSKHSSSKHSSSKSHNQNSQGINEAVAALDRKIAAWNKHDLAGVLNAYLDSGDTCLLTSSGTEIYGYEELSRKYQNWYGGKKAKSMGKLGYSGLRSIKLGENRALFTGHYSLDEEGEPHLEGLFSLIYLKTRQGWKIMHEQLSQTSRQARN